MGQDDHPDTDHRAALRLQDDEEYTPSEHLQLGEPNFGEPFEFLEPSSAEHSENISEGVSSHRYQDGGEKPRNDEGVSDDDVTGPLESKRTLNVRLIKRPSPEGNDSPDWIKGIMTDWKNPIFPASEETPKALGLMSRKSEQRSRPWSDPDQSLRQVLRVYLTVKDLEAAVVLGQVDSKFVACVTQEQDNGPVLFLIDQHAMDERIRLEHYLKRFLDGRDLDPSQPDAANTVEVVTLEPGERILLSKREADLLLVSDVIEWLRVWGIVVQPVHASERDSTGKEYIQVDIVGVPRILHRKLTQNSELQDVLKEIIDDIALKGAPQKPDTTNKELFNGGNAWIGTMRACPRALLDLIASRACRAPLLRLGSIKNLGSSNSLLHRSAGYSPTRIDWKTFGALRNGGQP
ncbi:DNA mismatch repair protein [Serendipita sp. 399]|nr:DNA mismatch repair protein [Serendipita sp. 399]